MPSRSRAEIRRGTGRLEDLLVEHAPTNPPLAAILPDVTASAEDLDAKWQFYQAARIRGTSERAERDTANVALLTWSRSWRGVVIIKVPGARENIRELPANGATPDDVVRRATDIRELIKTAVAAAPFREAAIKDLGTKIEDAARETKEASLALSAEQGALSAYGTATLEANTLLVQALDIVQNVFGAKSHAYKQFIASIRAAEDEVDEEDKDDGEDDGEDDDGADDGEDVGKDIVG